MSTTPDPVEITDNESEQVQRANASDRTPVAFVHGLWLLPSSWDRWVSGVPLFQAAAANLNPWTEDKVDTDNPERGPLLILSGEKDHTVPWALANAAYKQQKDNPSTTAIIEMPDRGHALTIDSGWREVAQTALDFVRRFT